MNKILLALILSISMAYGDFKDIDYKELKKKMSKNIVVIDIRTKEEFKKTGIIKNAHMLTFFQSSGKYNIGKWMNKFTKIVKDKNQEFVLYCAHANRSKVVGRFLSKKLKYKNVYELKGGIEYGWINKMQKVVPAF